MTCRSRNLIYVVICPTCKKEYIGKTGIGNSKFRDRVKTYRQHIRQSEHAKIKVEKHFRIVAKDSQYHYHTSRIICLRFFPEGY